MEGALDAEQRKKLMEIADKCPVHRTLKSEIHIVTRRRIDEPCGWRPGPATTSCAGTSG